MERSDNRVETNELEISNKIEEYILKLLGRDVIIMDKIVHLKVKKHLNG